MCICRTLHVMPVECLEIPYLIYQHIDIDRYRYRTQKVLRRETVLYPKAHIIDFQF